MKLTATGRAPAVADVRHVTARRLAPERQREIWYGNNGEKAHGVDDKCEKRGGDGEVTSK